MLFLFNVVAVARKERDALVGHGLVGVLAVLAAGFLAIGIVMRQRATMDVPQEHGVSSVMFLTLLRRPLWWAGTVAAFAGYALQAAFMDRLHDNIAFYVHSGSQPCKMAASGDRDDTR